MLVFSENFTYALNGWFHTLNQIILEHHWTFAYHSVIILGKQFWEVAHYCSDYITFLVVECKSWTGYLKNKWKKNTWIFDTGH